MRRVILCLSAMLIAVSGSAVAEDKSAFQQLLDDLTRKGVLTEEEAQKLGATAAKEEASRKVLAGYEKGFYLKSADDKFSLKINSYGQFRYTYFDKDQEIPGNAEDRSSFRVRRARIKLTGTAMEPWVFYQLQWETAGSSSSLRDYFIDVYDKKNLPEIGLKFGQFKPPFSRQFLTSSQLQIFPERAITNDQSGNDFSFDRDQGVAIHGKPWGESPNIEYTTGLFNGNGQNQTDNLDVGLLWVSRLDWNVLGTGNFGYSEGDVEDSQEVKWAVATSYGYNCVTPTSGVLTSVDDGISRWEFDTILKYMGFAFQGEYFTSNETPEDRVAGDPNGGINGKGGYVQASTFLIPQQLELASRYTYMNRDRAGEPNRQEAIAGLNYYFDESHWWKIQADLRRITIANDPGEDSRELQFIIQAQVSF